MDAREFRKIVKEECEKRTVRCDSLSACICPFLDSGVEDGECCSVSVNYNRKLDPVTIAEQIKRKQDKPGLPKKIPTRDTTTTLYTAFAAINGIIDYLTAKEALK